MCDVRANASLLNCATMNQVLISERAAAMTSRRDDLDFRAHEMKSKRTATNEDARRFHARLKRPLAANAASRKATNLCA